MERLESRNLLSTTVAACTGATDTVHNLVVTSDDAADVILVQPQGDGVIVTVNGLFLAAYVDIRSVAVFGGGGNDSITLRGTGIDYFADGGDDNDSIFGSAANDWLQDSYGDDLLVGGDGADYLAGGPGNDTLNGGPGNDAVLGEAGADHLFGGSGSDHTVADTLDTISGIEEVL